MNLCIKKEKILIKHENVTKREVEMNAHRKRLIYFTIRKKPYLNPLVYEIKTKNTDI